MPASIGASLDDKEFNAALKAYQLATGKEWPKILNTKAFFIALRWFGLTKKADQSNIERSIGKLISVQSGVFTRGKRKGQARVIKSALAIRADTNHDAPLAALIIQKRRAARGLPGLQGRPMRAAIIKMIGSRIRA